MFCPQLLQDAVISPGCIVVLTYQADTDDPVAVGNRLAATAGMLLAMVNFFMMLIMIVVVKVVVIYLGFIWYLSFVGTFFFFFLAA